MSRNEPVEITLLQAEAVEVVPAAHVFSGSRHSRDLSKDLQQAIIVEVQKAGVVFVKLFLHRTVMKLHIGIGKCRQWSRHRRQALRRALPGCQWPRCADAGRAGASGLDEGSAVESRGHSGSSASLRNRLLKNARTRAALCQLISIPNKKASRGSPGIGHLTDASSGRTDRAIAREDFLARFLSAIRVYR